MQFGLSQMGSRPIAAAVALSGARGSDMQGIETCEETGVPMQHGGKGQVADHWACGLPSSCVEGTDSGQKARRGFFACTASASYTSESLLEPAVKQDRLAKPACLIDKHLANRRPGGAPATNGSDNLDDLQLNRKAPGEQTICARNKRQTSSMVLSGPTNMGLGYQFLGVRVAKHRNLQCSTKLLWDMQTPGNPE